MPIYEYICKDCGNEFEQLVSRSDSEISCSKCGSGNLEKQFSVFGTASASSGPTCPAAGNCPAESGGCGCHGKCGCHH